ncbi:hypothetical protein JQ559_29160 [Bradyrhizobium viridifuturi]|jgi:hypothetical protein|nr:MULTISPECIES: hypothetical protein [Bradyrhizobium]QRI70555.1 hypothetical protein JQ507_03165 [Bradyrhizobium sp. PSBB068]MBR1023345.1 hypothetical protein [Bradyrhizobium viridifuturi]MBR1040222.1 hypothetical protein [Bradyrhizobium viridifuturi]MBR1047733.1 hypothetical protein [Bradyrhizobium viridifuturi]MBR1077222.1 hypothetical protein [Bradyrhizobium viridifuturi]
MAKSDLHELYATAGRVSSAEYRGSMSRRGPNDSLSLEFAVIGREKEKPPASEISHYTLGCVMCNIPREPARDARSALGWID